MRKLLIAIIVIMALIFGIRYFIQRNAESERLVENTALIEKQVRNVGKLVVTEGTFAQVFTYENSKKFYLDVFSAKKKALIIINAKVSISYDLRKLETSIDQDQKTITITRIPEPEIDINPDIEYYDVTQDYLNQFEAKDYNAIKTKVNMLINRKIEVSDLMSNAKNRLLSELANIYITTNSLGWTLIYKDIPIERKGQLKALIP